MIEEHVKYVFNCPRFAAHWVEARAQFAPKNGRHASLWYILEGKSNEGDSQCAKEGGASKEGDKYQYMPEFVTDPAP